MLWIGITGPIGSGKSTVSSLLRERGYPVLDADEVVHTILAAGGPVERQVLQTFGEHLRDKSGALDRRALGQVVFADPTKLVQLEQILHPLVRKFVSDQRVRLSAAGNNAAFYDVPLLYEKSMQDQFDHVLVVSSPAKLRQERVRLRSQLAPAEFEARAARQMNPAEKERKASAVIRNELGWAELSAEIDRALSQLQIPSPTATKP